MLKIVCCSSMTGHLVGDDLDLSNGKQVVGMVMDLGASNFDICIQRMSNGDQRRDILAYGGL